MDDRKPSQFLRHLKSLAADVPDDFLRSIWSSRLPTHIQIILARQAEGNKDSATQLPTTALVAQASDSANRLQRIDDLPSEFRV